MVDAITVGDGVNLLFGYKSVWDPTGPIASPFFQLPVTPIQQQNPVTTPSSFDLWVPSPLITLHRSAQSL